MLRRVLLSVPILQAFSSAAFAVGARRDAATWVAELSTGYGVTANVTYLSLDGQDVKLDVYAPRGAGTSARGALPERSSRTWRT